MTHGVLRKLAALLLLSTLWPTLALGQQTTAGVVTTLQGVATVARAALPQETPLKFKDDVFYRDRITTKENSLVRVLLGGKALVTVRELSVLTLTEEPGKATVDVQSGKIGLAVARLRMRPGESIEVRTPNAIAAVRGTMIIVEVILGAPGAPPTTLINVLTGSATISLPQVPTAASVTVQAGQSLPISGNTIGPVGTVSPAAAAGLTSGTGSQHLEAPPATTEQLGTNQQAQATAVATAIAPPAPAQAPVAAAATSNEQPSTSDVGVQSDAASKAAQTPPPSPAPLPFAIQGFGALSVDSGTSLATFSVGSSQTPEGGGLVCATPPCTPIVLTTPVVVGRAASGGIISATSPTGEAVLKITDTTLTAGGSPLFAVTGPLTVNASKLLTVDPSTLTLTGSLLSINAATVNSSSTLFSVMDSTVKATGVGVPLVDVDNGQLSVAGSFLDGTNSNITVNGALIRLKNKSTATVKGSPVFKISGGSLTADMLGSSDSSGNTFDLTGTLLDLSNTTVKLHTLGKEDLDNDLDTATFNLALNEPFIKMSSSTLELSEVDEHLADMGEKTGHENGVMLIASGTLAKKSTINLKGSLLKMKAVDSRATDALVQLDNTIINQTGTSDALILVNPNGLASTMAGPLLTATGTTITTSGPTFYFNGTGNLTAPGNLTSKTTDHFIGIDPSTVTSSSQFVLLDGGFNLTLHGKLLSASDVKFSNTSDQFSFFAIVDGAIVKTTDTTAPLLEFTGTTSGTSKVTAARFFLPMIIATPGKPAPSMELSGPLLSAVKTDLKTGNPTTNTYSFLFIGDGAQLTGPMDSPLLSFDNSTVDTSGNLLSLRRSPTTLAPSKLTLSGPLFSAKNISTFNTTSLGFGSTFSTSPAACCHGFLIGQGAKLTAATTAALIQLVNSTFNAGPDPESGGSFFGVHDTFSGAPAGELVASASVILGDDDKKVTAGPLLTATDSTISALSHLLHVTRSTFTSNGTAPLVQLIGTTDVPASVRTLTIGGADPVSSTTTSGSLLFIGSFTGGSNSPASVSLKGPFLEATNYTINTTAGALSVFNGATLTSSNTNLPFVKFDNTTLTTGAGFGGDFLNVSGLGGATGTTPSSASFSGPLLVATKGSNVTLQRDVIIGSQNPTITGTGTDPFIQVSGSTLTLASGGEVAGLFNGTKLNLSGPLLSVASTLTAPRGLANISNGSYLAVAGSTTPVVSITGGTHTIASDSPSSMFNLVGRDTPVTTTPETVEGIPLTLGIDRPLRGETSGSPLSLQRMLFEASGATIGAGPSPVQQGVRLDTALFEATKPLFNLTASSALTSANSLVNLVQKAKLIADLPSDAVIKLSNSNLTVNNGSLFSVAGGATGANGSYLNVTGNLVSLTGTSTLSILNGGLVGLSGGSVFRLTGSFGSVGAGSTISLPTSLAGYTMDTTLGFGVALKTGVAALSQVSTAGTFMPFTGPGTVTPSGIVLKIDDAASKVKLCTTGC